MILRIFPSEQLEGQIHHLLKWEGPFPSKRRRMKSSVVDILGLKGLPGVHVECQ